MGDCEARALAPVESQYAIPFIYFEHPNLDDEHQGPCMVGSLTGTVSSQRVTEEHKGTLNTVGNRM